MRDISVLSTRSWAPFAYAMIVLAPIFGSLTTAVEIVAAVIAIIIMRKEGMGSVSSLQRVICAIILAYFAYFLIRGAFAPSWKGYGGAMLSITGFVYFVPLFLFLPSRLETLSAAMISRVATVTIFIVVVLALFASLVLHKERVDLFAGNELPFSAIVLITCFMAPLGWHEKSLRQQLLAIVAVLLGLFVIAVLAKSRGSAATWVVLLVPLLIYIGGARRLSAVLVACGILVAVAATLIAIELSDDGAVFQRFWTPLHYLISGGTAGHLGAPINERLIMYKAGIQAFLAQPVFGYGPQNRFNGAVPYMVGGHFWHHHLHNLFLTHAVGGGIFGVAVLCAFLAIPLIVARFGVRRNADTTYLAWMLTLGLTGVGMTNLLSFYDLTVSFSLFNMLLLLALTSAGTRCVRQKAPSAPAGPGP